MASRKYHPGGGQLLFDAFLPPSSWTPPDLNSLPSWAEAKRVCIDSETEDRLLKKMGPGVRRGGRMVGFSFCIEGDRPYYLPFGHDGGGNLDPEQCLRYMRDQARAFRGELVGANMSYDLDYMAEQGIHWNPSYHRDVQIADPLINELHQSYSLQSIAGRHGFEGKDVELLETAAKVYGIEKHQMYQLHSRYVGPYGEQDALLPLQLLRRQEIELNKQELWSIFNLESELLPVLVKLRRRGVRVSLERLAKVVAWANEEGMTALREVQDKTGVALALGDVWKPEAMAMPLRAIGVVFKAGVKPSVTKQMLAGLDHPVAKLLARARKFSKIEQFGATIREHQIKGRIHCTFNQLRKTKDEDEEGEDEGEGARYGRLSCSDPNMQQQPGRDEEVAKVWRSIYLPEEGEEWCSPDYSQQEPRWLIHFAELCELPGAREAAQKYRDDPSTDNHDMMTRAIHGAAVDTWDKKTYKTFRTYCKQIFLGMCYGMGGVKLCRNLGFPTKWQPHWNEEKARLGIKVEVAGDEGQAVIDKFNRGAPFVKGLAKVCEKKAQRTGVIITVLGRRCHFPALEGGGWDWCHKALNRLIQGSSADQTKKAMVEADKAGLPVILQVHDEIPMSISSRRQAEQMVEVMTHCVPCNVPPKVDCEFGDSWGDSM